MNKWLFSIIFVLLLTVSVFAEANVISEDSLDIIKSKSMAVTVKIEIPIVVSNYTDKDYFIYKTPIFTSFSNQKVDVLAYYTDSKGIQQYATIEDDDFSNKIASFNISKIDLNKYTFIIEGNLNIENNFSFVTNTIIPSDLNKYLVPTKNIQSNSKEILSIGNTITQATDKIKEIVDVTNWVHQNIAYDTGYGANEIIDAQTVLNDRKGVCDEFSNLEAAILRGKGYPVRYINGFANSSVQWEPHAWLEVYVSEYGWISVDPTYEEVGLTDASHIVVSKTTDPDDIKDVITTIDGVSIDFGNKKNSFNINSIDYFTKNDFNVDVSVSVPEKSRVNSNVQFNVDFNNYSNKPFISKTIISTYNTFSLVYPKSNEYVVYLKPFEKRTICYNYIAPSSTNGMSYQYVFQNQYFDIDSWIDIFPNDGVFQEIYLVYEPVFYFHNDSLFVDFNIINHTSKKKTLNIVFTIGEDDVSDIFSVEPWNNNVYKRNFGIIDNKSIDIAISGDYNYLNTIYFYSANDSSNNENYIDITIIANDNNKNANETNQSVIIQKDNTTAGDANSSYNNFIEALNRNRLRSYLAMFIVILIILIIIIALVSKFRKRELNLTHLN